jgi:hypothetical protein
MQIKDDLKDYLLWKTPNLPLSGRKKTSTSVNTHEIQMFALSYG